MGLKFSRINDSTNPHVGHVDVLGRRPHLLVEGVAAEAEGLPVALALPHLLEGVLEAVRAGPEQVVVGDGVGSGVGVLRVGVVDVFFGWNSGWMEGEKLGDGVWGCQGM